MFCTEWPDSTNTANTSLGNFPAVTLLVPIMFENLDPGLCSLIFSSVASWPVHGSEQAITCEAVGT